MAIGAGAIKAASAYVELRATGLKAVQGALRSASRSVGRFAADVTKMGAALIAVGSAAAAGLTVAVKYATDLSESINKTNEVFGESASIIEDFGRTSANAFGISTRAANAYASELGLILLQTGSTEAEAAKMSVQLVKLAADIASFNNISIDEALIKLKAGLVGSSEPLRSVGVLLSAAAVDAKAAELGFERVGKNFSEGAKVAARYALILEQTEKTQGDFTRTSEGLANTTRRIQATFEDLVSSIGAAVEPAFEKAAAVVFKVVNALAMFVKNNPALVRAFAVVTAAVVALGAALVAAGGAVSAMLVVLNALVGVFAVLTSPVTLIVAGIAALVAGITALVALPVVGFFTAWIKYSESAQSLVASLGVELGKLLEIGKETFAGIFEAIQSGNWAEAAKIAMAGLKLAYFTGMEAISEQWPIWMDQLYKSFSETFEALAKVAKQLFEYLASQFTLLSLAASEALAGRFQNASEFAKGLGAAFELPDIEFNPFGNFKEQKDKAQKDLDDLLNAQRYRKFWSEVGDAFVDGLPDSISADDASTGATGSWASALADNFMKNLRNASPFDLPGEAAGAETIAQGQRRITGGSVGTFFGGLAAQAAGGSSVQGTIKQGTKDTVKAIEKQTSVIKNQEEPAASTALANFLRTLAVR